MTMEIYAIKDTKVAYNLPFYQHNQAEAQRNFAAAVRDTNGIMSKNPADFELWKLGTYDDETGLIYGGQPCYICSGMEVVNRG